MASNFPSVGIDSFTTKADATDYPTAAHINDLQNAVVAVQTKVGVDSSADTDSLDYKIANMWETIYPVGAIYLSYVSTSPASLFGGTWEAIAAGMVLVGYNGSDTDFNAAGKTGGAKTHTLTAAQMPAHTHTQNAHSHSANVQWGTANYDQNRRSDTGTGNYAGSGASTRNVDSTTATNQNTGGGGAHNNLQPFFTVYMWRRTA